MLRARVLLARVLNTISVPFTHAHDHWAARNVFQLASSSHYDYALGIRSSWYIFTQSIKQAINQSSNRAHATESVWVIVGW